MKKYFIFSDAHGQFHVLHDALTAAGFDENNDNHILLSLGDHFDRGPENHLVLEFLLDMWRKKRFIGILGNHDEFLMGYLNLKNHQFDIENNGFGRTLQNLVPDLAAFKDKYHEKSYRWSQYQPVIVDRIIEKYPDIELFLNDLRDIYVFGQYRFLHAGFSQTPIVKEWYVNCWARTPNFVKNFEAETIGTWVFGHWAAFKLIEEFEKRQTTVENRGSIPFLYTNEYGQRFVGIDGWINLHYQMPILTMTEENGVFILKFGNQIIE